MGEFSDYYGSEGAPPPSQDPVGGDMSGGTPDTFNLGDVSVAAPNAATDSGDQFALDNLPGSDIKPSGLGSGGGLAEALGGAMTIGRGALAGFHIGGGGSMDISGAPTLDTSRSLTAKRPLVYVDSQGRVKASSKFGAIARGLLKYIGPAQLAQFLGVTIEALLVLLVSTRKRHRRRGVTGRQLANAARVARTLSSMQSQFRRAAGLGGVHHSRRLPPPRPFHRRRK